MTLINANLSKEIKEFLDVLGDIKIDLEENKAIDFENKIATSFREVGKMLDIFRLGPMSDASVIPMGKSWSNALIRVPLENVRQKILKKNEENKDDDTKPQYYAFLVKFKDEGVTIWFLNVNNKFDLSEKPKEDNQGNNNQDDENKEETNNKFIKTLDGYILQKQWNTAFTKMAELLNSSKEEDKENAQPFAISAIISITGKKIPFFGRCGFGLALKDGVISLCQVPTMSRNTNTGKGMTYIIWNFISKKPMTEHELFQNYKRNGGSTNFNDFNKIRDFLEKDCEPLNPKGEYKFTSKGSSTQESYNYMYNKLNDNTNVKRAMKEAYNLALKESIKEEAVMYPYTEAKHLYYETSLGDYEYDDEKDKEPEDSKKQEALPKGNDGHNNYVTSTEPIADVLKRGPLY